MLKKTNFHLLESLKTKKTKFTKQALIKQKCPGFIDKNKQLERRNFIKSNINKKLYKKLSDLSAQRNEEIIKNLSEKIIKIGGKPSLDNKNEKDLIKVLNKQFEQLSVKKVSLLSKWCFTKTWYRFHCWISNRF